MAAPGRGVAAASTAYYQAGAEPVPQRQQQPMQQQQLQQQQLQQQPMQQQPMQQQQLQQQPVQQQWQQQPMQQQPMQQQWQQPGAVTPDTFLYPALECNFSGRLKVSAVHEMYYEESGNPMGYPVLSIHGGPGAGSSPNDRRFFDPKFYRIILFDQRGAGKSTPSASIEDNTTWHLTSDIERLRQHLKVESWLVFGGSWGSTLALAYAETYPDRVDALILRGIFTARRKELNWLYQEGASTFFPDYWQDYVSQIPESERSDLLAAYYRRVTGPNEEERLRCARAYTMWECSITKSRLDPQLLEKWSAPAFAETFARIGLHYFMSSAFLKTEDQLIQDAGRIRHIPTTIIQGRFDMVCPVETAWDLHRALPESTLTIVDQAGHSHYEPGITEKLVEACNKFREFVLSNGPTRRPFPGTPGAKLEFPGNKYNVSGRQRQQQQGTMQRVPSAAGAIGPSPYAAANTPASAPLPSTPARPLFTSTTTPTATAATATTTSPQGPAPTSRAPSSSEIVLNNKGPSSPTRSAGIPSPRAYEVSPGRDLPNAPQLRRSQPPGGSSKTVLG